MQTPQTEASPATLSLLTELVQGLVRPAVFNTEQGTPVCMNAAAVRAIDPTPGAGVPADWPRRFALQIDGQTFHLAAADPSEGTTSRRLPPRLDKIAKLVIAGLTDKQIAGRIGLTFSTVRTYVRQIYRRCGVHSRVELVYAMRG